MSGVTEPLPHSILAEAEGPAAEIVNPEGKASICLVCEHASAVIPASLGDLGLRAADRFSHAVWDPGGAALSRELSGQLDARLVLGRVSRLVIDCNRPPERADAMPSQVETIEIPGNRSLRSAERQARKAEVYDPFHGCVEEALDATPGDPVLVTIHSFTPSWHGTARATEIGILHDRDPSLALAIMASADASHRTELNEPYSMKDGVTHMLQRHGTERGIRNVMIEVRNDLLAPEGAPERIAGVLTRMLNAALAEGADAA